jgi:hypothetical protein
LSISRPYTKAAVAGDEDEDLGRVAEAVVPDGDPRHHVGRDVVEEKSRQRQPAKKVEAQIAPVGMMGGIAPLTLGKGGMRRAPPERRRSGVSAFRPA